MKRLFIFIAITTIILLLIIVVKSLITSTEKASETVPTPSVVKISPSAPVVPNQGEALPNTFLKNDSNSYSQIPSVIGKLVGGLPYRGRLFSLFYDYSKDSFTLYLNKNDQQNAEKEFEDYLRSTNVQDKNWLQNLSTVYQ